MPQKINDSFQVNAPKSIDQKYTKYENGMSVPYLSTDEANAAININYRFEGLQVAINDGTGLKVYVYTGGVEDENLVELLHDYGFLTEETDPVWTADKTNYYTKTQVDSAVDAKQDLIPYTTVPNTRTVNGYPLSSNIELTKNDVGLSNVDNTSDYNKPVSNATSVALATKADLDTNGKVLLSQIPDTLVGQVKYQGTWDASTNTPTLTSPDSTASKHGQYYVTNVAGTEFGLDFQVGDWVINNNGNWQKVDNTDAVSSVNGMTGAVLIDKASVGLSNVQNIDTSVASNVTTDETHRFVTDSDKLTWNAKQDSISQGNGISITSNQISLGGTLTGNVSFANPSYDFSIGSTTFAANGNVSVIRPANGVQMFSLFSGGLIVKDGNSGGTMLNLQAASFNVPQFATSNASYFLKADGFGNVTSAALPAETDPVYLANGVSLAGTQTITGTKIFSSIASFSSYNTADQTTNYDRVTGTWNSNVFEIGSYYGGVGGSGNSIVRSMRLGVNTTAAASNLSTSSRTFTINSTPTVSQGVFDFSPSTTSITGSVVTIRGAGTASSGTQSWVTIQPTFNVTGSPTLNTLLIQPWFQAGGSGSNYLINAGTQSAADGGGTFTQRFFITSAGIGYISSRFAVGNPSATASLQISSNNSTNANYGTTGLGFVIDPASYTSSSATGTISFGTAHSVGIPTLAASNATTLTNAATFYIAGVPTAGTNVTITNSWAAYINGNIGVNGDVLPLTNNSYNLGNSSFRWNQALIITTLTNFIKPVSGTDVSIRNFGGSDIAKFFGATANLVLQNGGTLTDSGYRLDVQGTARFTGGILQAFLTKSTDPTTTDIPSGYSALYKNTTSGVTKLWLNDGGTLKSVALT